MAHLIWLTNIPSPYRSHRYELMRDILTEHGITFEVSFMAHRTGPTALDAQALKTMGDESRAAHWRTVASCAAIDNLAAQLAELIRAKYRS